MFLRMTNVSAKLAKHTEIKMHTKNILRLSFIKFFIYYEKILIKIYISLFLLFYLILLLDLYYH